jgi:DNA polymerase III subunit epsilon
MKYIVLDCETTGTNPALHGLIQMAGVIVVDGKVVDKFDFKLCTFPDDVIEDEALKVNGITREQIQSWTVPFEIYQRFTKLLARYCDKFDRSDKFFFVGYNGDFDASFVRRFFEKCGDKYFGSWFWWPIIDIAKLAGIRLMHDRHLMPDFKLVTVATHMQIPFNPEALHDAMADVAVTVQLFKRLMVDIPTMGSIVKHTVK